MKVNLIFFLALAAAPFGAATELLECGAGIQAEHCGDCLEAAGNNDPASCGGDCLFNADHSMCFPATFADPTSYYLGLRIMCPGGIPEYDSGVEVALDVAHVQLEIIAGTNRRELASRKLTQCSDYCPSYMSNAECMDTMGFPCNRRRDLLENEANMKEVNMEGERDLSSHSQEITPSALCGDVISEFEGTLRNTLADTTHLDIIMNPDHCTISCFMHYDIEE